VGTAAGFSIVANGTRTPTFFDQNLMGTATIVTINGHRFVKVTKLQLFFNDTSTTTMKNALGNTATLRDLFGSVTFLVRLM
jgi:hypothetical protein